MSCTIEWCGHSHDTLARREKDKLIAKMRARAAKPVPRRPPPRTKTVEVIITSSGAKAIRFPHGEGFISLPYLSIYEGT